MGFLYYGYGSNLLHKRLLLNNPSAKFVDVAELKDYALKFVSIGDPKTSRWKGAVATIRESPGNAVWGCVWNLEDKDLETLNKQEGIYDGKTVEVKTADKKVYMCRTYQLPERYFKLERDNRPSPMYIDVIIRGARENCLPADYIAHLEGVETNGSKDRCEVYEKTLQLVNDDKKST